MSSLNSFASLLRSARVNGDTLKSVSDRIGFKYTRVLSLVKACREAGIEVPNFPKGRPNGWRKDMELSPQEQAAIENELTASGLDPMEV